MDKTIEDMLLGLNAKGYRIVLKNHAMLNPISAKRVLYPEEPEHVEGFVCDAYAPRPEESILGGVHSDPTEAVRYTYVRAEERTTPLTPRKEQD